MVHKEKVTSIVERRICRSFFCVTVPSTWSSAYVGAKTCEFGTWSWVPHRSVPLDPILSPCILFASTLLILLYRSIAEYLHRHRPVGMHALYDCKYLCRVRKRAFGRGLCVVGREKENISCALFVFSFLKKIAIPQSTTQPFRVGLSAFVRACVF